MGSVRAVVYIDATIESDSPWSSDKHLRHAISEANTVLPRGSLIRLHVGSKWAPWPAGSFNPRMVGAEWLAFVEKFHIEIEGTPGAVQAWTETLRECAPQPREAAS